MNGPQSRPRWRTRLATAIGASVFFVLAGTGVAYAYWVAKAAIGATASSTNAAVALNGSSGLTTTYTTSAKGPVIAALTLANNGGAPLTLTLTASHDNAGLAGAISLTYWVRSGTACGTTVPTTGTTTGTLAAPPALPSGATTAAAGASVVICAATSFTGDYATYAGKSVAVTLTLTGKVGSNWTATGTGTFTQSLQATSSLTCTTNKPGENSGYAVLSWTPPADWTAWPKGYYVMTGSVVLSDGGLWYNAPTQAVRPDKFASGGYITGTYKVEVWAVLDAAAPFTKTGSVLIGTQDVVLHSAGGWYAVKCG